MSAAHEIEQQDTGAPETGLLHRTFTVDAQEGDGRTIDVRIVPYGERATVNDGRGSYEEEFVAGAFEDQLVAGHRLKVWLNFQHERGIEAVIGRGVALREELDGLYGSFRAFSDKAGDKALMLVREGMLDGVSLEFLSKKQHRTADGVVQRVRAHLDAVALCRQGAYASAQVLAVREEAKEVTVDEALLPVGLNPELVERCRELGISLPQRYETHPAGTDTPAEVGTSEAAPVDTENVDTEE